MPVDATITLDTLQCLAEHDTGSGGSEPYLWPIYFWSDQGLQQRLEFLELQAASKAQPSAPLTTGMRPGDRITLPFPPFTRRIDGRMSGEGIGLIVVLLEKDKTPEQAMTVGRNTLVALLRNELRAFIAEKGRPPHTGQVGVDDCAEEVGADGICDEVTPMVGRIQEQVVKAVAAELNIFQKFQNMDDVLGFDLHRRALSEGDQVNEELVLDIRQGGDPPRQHYRVTGTLSVRPTVPTAERCVREREALRQATQEVAGIELQIANHQAELHDAPPRVKEGLAELIRELQSGLPAARAAVVAADRRLTICLDAFEPVEPIQTPSSGKKDST